MNARMHTKNIISMIGVTATMIVAYCVLKRIIIGVEQQLGYTNSVLASNSSYGVAINGGSNLEVMITSFLGFVVVSAGMFFYNHYFLLKKKLIEFEKAFDKDAITGLHSFKNFLKLMPIMLDKCKENEYVTAVVIVSMDDFKKINSVGGYQIGNEVLHQFADSFSKHIQQDELIARYFGDEIIMMLKAENEHLLKERILDIWKDKIKLITVEDREFYIKISMGIRIVTDYMSEVNALIDQTTIARTKAKKNGGNRWEFYNEEINNKLKIETDIENALYHALDNQELYLVYQPIVNSNTYEIYVNEALLRWDNEKFGHIPINEIVELAEKKGIILEIGQWVLWEACRQNKQWQDMGIGHFRVSVNVSVKQLEDPFFVEIVQGILAETGMEGKYLQLEITESNAMTDVENKICTINELKEMGITISIDDFGTGYSSLSYFAKLPIDNLKIDKSFVNVMNTDNNAKMIINTIINMAIAMNISTTAEGVEERSQASILKFMGCNNLQGYMITRPVKPFLLEKLMVEVPQIKQKTNLVENSTVTQVPRKTIATLL